MSKKWHVARGDRKVGPISDQQLKEFAASGKLKPEDLIWKDGMDEWKPASNVKGLFPSKPAGPPELPVPVQTPGPATQNKFCSNCGTKLQSGAKFCASCGTSIGGIAAENQEAEKNECPICSMAITGNPKECEHCHLPIGNPIALQNLQRNLIAEQQRLRSELPECVQFLEPDEFIAYMTPAENNSKTYVLTETRLLVFKVAGWITARNELEYSVELSDVVSYPLLADTEFQGLGIEIHFPLNTSHGQIDLWFTSNVFSMSEGNSCIEFQMAFGFAHEALMRGSRISGALLIRKELG